MRYPLAILMALIIFPCATLATDLDDYFPGPELDHWSYDIVRFWIDQGHLDEFQGVLPAEEVSEDNRLTNEEFYAITSYIARKFANTRDDDGVMKWLIEPMEQEYYSRSFFARLNKDLDTVMPPQHWTYLALNYLQESRGFLKDYPVGFFSDNCPRTAASLAHATADVLETIGVGEGKDDGVLIMVETLRVEFHEVLLVFLSEEHEPSYWNC